MILLALVFGLLFPPMFPVQTSPHIVGCVSGTNNATCPIPTLPPPIIGCGSGFDNSTCPAPPPGSEIMPPGVCADNSTNCGQ
jgi:hypothetical protein